MSNSPAVLRELRPGDEPAIGQLERRVGFEPTTTDLWQQLWANPVLRTHGWPAGLGWVLDTGNELVGHFGSIPMLYALGERTLLAAAARGVIVDPTLRGSGQGRRMAEAFFGQTNVDLLLSTTTNHVASRLFRKLGVLWSPQPNYHLAPYWVIRAFRFMRCSLAKVGVPPMIATPLGGLLAPLLRADILLRGRRPRSAAGKVDVIEVEQIGKEFDELWDRKRREATCLLAFRTAELLTWRFCKPSNRRATRLLCLRRSGRLIGYAIVERLTIKPIGMVRSRIVDVIAEGDDVEAVDLLIRACFELAQGDGSDVLEVLGFPHAIRHRMHRAKPHIRRLPVSPFMYLPVSPGLHETLADPAAWYACPLDGDTTLRGDV